MRFRFRNYPHLGRKRRFKLYRHNRRAFLWYDPVVGHEFVILKNKRR